MSAYPPISVLNPFNEGSISSGAQSVRGDSSLGATITDSTSAIVSKSVMTVKDVITGDYTPLEGTGGNLIISTGANSIISTDNSYNSTLLASTTFTGTFEDVLEYTSLTITGSGNQNATLYIDWSLDGLTVERTHQLSDLSTDLGARCLPVKAQYFRIRIVNDTVDNTITLETLLNLRSKATTGQISSSLNDYSEVQTTRTVLVAKDQNDTYQNVRSNYSGEMIVEARIMPQWDGLGFKSSNPDGTIGIVVNGRRYRAQEIVQRTNTIFSTGKSTVPLLGAGQYIKIPNGLEAPQISSSSASDSYALDNLGARTVLIQGWSINGNGEWYVAVDLYQLNGQTPVTGLFGTQFIRVIGAQVVETGSNVGINTFKQACVGNLYVTSQGEPLTAGVPNTLSNTVWAISRAGDGVFYHAYVGTPPGAITVWSEHVFGGATATNTTINMLMEYFIRTVPVTGQPNTAAQICAWKEAAVLVSTTDVGSASAHQSSFPNLDGSLNGELPNDITIITRRVSGNSDNVFFFSNLTGNFVTNASYGI